MKTPHNENDPNISNPDDGFLDYSEINETAFDLPRVDTPDFVELFREMLLNPNQGAGIDVSGASGSGKSNFMEWAAMESLKLGIPILVIDPHGDSARRINQNIQALPERLKKKRFTLSFPARIQSPR